MENFLQRQTATIPLKITLGLEAAGSKINQYIFEKLSICYEHRCFSGAIIMNLDPQSMEVEPPRCFKDYMEVKVKIKCDLVSFIGTPTIEVTVLDIKDSFAMCANEYVKCYMEFDKFPNYTPQSRPDDVVVLLSDNDSEIAIGVNILVKILDIECVFKETTFIANVDFVGTSSTSNKKTIQSRNQLE